MNNDTETTHTSEVSNKRRRAPSVKRAQTRVQKEQSRGFPLPLVLTCPVTGKAAKYTSLPYIRKLVEKYGSVEGIKKNYVSAEGRKAKQNSEN
jgi:hypothetical protein